MSASVVPVRRALISVYDKKGLEEFARFLVAHGVELLASGGSRTALASWGLPVIEVSEYTGQAEILGGRVKTLHPKIHAGILARRDLPGDLEALTAQGFAPIDLVVVNLYPFEATIARPGASFEDAVENIDIGGPTLIRAAAKNHAHVAVATRPDQYRSIVTALESNGGTTLEDRQRLCREAFRLTATYDQAIAAYLSRIIPPREGEAPAKPVLSSQNPSGSAGASPSQVDSASGSQISSFPSSFQINFQLARPLRYGENPHQNAAFYIASGENGKNLATAAIRHGKELSYNNLLDLDSALRLIRLFDPPMACILKHNNPCGVAVGVELGGAFERAYECDPVSAFGGIVGFNRPVDLATAKQMCRPGRFLEAVLAPGYDDNAFQWLTTKPSWRESVRLVDLGGPIGPDSPSPSGFDLRRLEGGLLVQDFDQLEVHPETGSVPTQRAPSDQEKQDLSFAWRVCSAVRSNAIVLAKDGQLIGVGAGQMSRLDSVKIAVEKAGARAQGSVLASDAFFPFRDGPDAAAAAGVTAIIQPGGSKRDAETIKACDEHGIAMIFTGRRHFRH
jgi:phosphoribosylaminoimidazolecarboxamide formyltransferase / IMP cyclohydrolase